MLALLFLLRSSGPRTCLVLISAERGGYLLGGLLIAQGALSLLWLEKVQKILFVELSWVASECP